MSGIRSTSGWTQLLTFSRRSLKFKVTHIMQPSFPIDVRTFPAMLFLYLHSKRDKDASAQWCYLLPTYRLSWPPADTEGWPLRRLTSTITIVRMAWCTSAVMQFLAWPFQLYTLTIQQCNQCIREGCKIDMIVFYSRINAKQRLDYLRVLVKNILAAIWTYIIVNLHLHVYHSTCVLFIEWDHNNTNRDHHN